MQADRGFTLSHQKVALELGFSGVLAGFTELTIVPSNAALRHIYLHARCMDIQRVLCNGQEVRFEHTDAVQSLALSDIHGHAQLKRDLFSATSQGLSLIHIRTFASRARILWHRRKCRC